MCIRSLSQWRTYIRLLLSNNKQVENSVNKDGKGTWDNQQSAVQTGGEATPADTKKQSPAQNYPQC
jgi:hypothetical protein